MSTEESYRSRREAARELASRRTRAARYESAMRAYLTGTAYRDTHVPPPAGSKVRVLVVYASKHGSTGEVAQWIGQELRAAGIDVEARPAGAVGSVTGFDAVVLGSAVYMGRWRREARQFVRRHARNLRHRAVWLFSTGPLDHSAEQGEQPATPSQAASLAEQLRARDHVTFGGALAADVKGIPDAMVARRSHGDFRDPEAVRAWAAGIASALGETRRHPS